MAARLSDLATKIGSQEAGYEFQTWFDDLMDFFEVVNRRPYTAPGRQIDGSITVSGTTYLVELKFTRDQVGATDIDSVVKKINDKADNTMGVMVSMSGYSTIALTEASVTCTTRWADQPALERSLIGCVVTRLKQERRSCPPSVSAVD